MGPASAAVPGAETDCLPSLRPPVLDAFGVLAAAAHLVYESIAQWRAHITFQHAVLFRRLEPSLENAIYRIAQESLTNACQHSQSDKIHLELTQHGEAVRISVQDWGSGFDPQSAGEKCFGLAGIRQRRPPAGRTRLPHDPTRSRQPHRGRTATRVQCPGHSGPRPPPCSREPTVRCHRSINDMFQQLP